MILTKRAAELLAVVRERIPWLADVPEPSTAGGTKNQ